MRPVRFSSVDTWKLCDREVGLFVSLPRVGRCSEECLERYPLRHAIWISIPKLALEVGFSGSVASRHEKQSFVCGDEKRRAKLARVRF